MNKKKPCKLALSDNSKDDFQIPALLQEKNVKITCENSIDAHECSYCNMKFTRRDNLRVHLNSRCKSKKINETNELEKEAIFMKLIEQNEKINQQMIQQKHQIDLLQNEIRNMKSGTNIDKQQIIDKQIVDKQQIIDKQIVNNNNVKLIAFGQEDMSYITDNVCKQILSKGFQSVPKLIEQVHFNKDKPEYHNVYIPNFKNNFAMVFDGDDWGLRDRDSIIDQLDDEKTEFICGKFHELLEAGELSASTIKKLKRFLNEKDEEPAGTNLKNDIKLILYNKRNMVLNTKKKVTGLLK
jgi:hypothetical protein